MAFPANLNINYYRGDTYEFKIYPKLANGQSFSLDEYDQTSGVKFTIAEERGAEGAATKVEAFAEISLDNTHINCAIRPDDGNSLDASKTYVYDVEISKPASDPSTYDRVFTLLTGAITVTEQVTGA